MKKIFTLFTLLSTSVAALAQTPFTSANIPADGTSVSSQSVTYSGSTPTTGTGQTWDFSALSFSGTIATNTVRTNVSTSAAAASFPSATFYEVTSSGTQLFHQVTSGANIALGSYDPTQGITIVDTDTEIATSFPFSYGDTQNDTYAGDYTANSIPVTRTGTISTTYSGYGTLITEDGTLNNISMLTSVSDETQTFNYGAFSLVTRFVTTSYSWSYPGDYSSRFFIYTLDTYEMGTLVSSTTVATKILGGLPTAITQTTHALAANVFPQPAQDQVHISAEDMNGSCETTVFNLNGEIVKSTTLTAADNVVNFSVADLEKGLYTVEVRNEGKVFRQKLSVQ